MPWDSPYIAPAFVGRVSNASLPWKKNFPAISGQATYRSDYFMCLVVNDAYQFIVT